LKLDSRFRGNDKKSNNDKINPKLLYNIIVSNLGKLYIVATPIGNLEDITLRALRVLKEADLILCEDTRVTKKLLDRYEISKPLLSYHHHSKLSRVEKIVEHLENGKNLALVSDAGTPGINDPGNELIAKFGNWGDEGDKKKIEIIPIPGASAITALASVAGINMSRFTFLGFPPHKKGRETFFRSVAKNEYPVIYFESPHRFLKNLELLEKMKPDAKLIVGRELTKMFEEILRGGIGEIRENWEKKPEKEKRGEFVVIVC
jgi:16S rRNA (cytidine1402-2'-O)-methyltransferase